MKKLIEAITGGDEDFFTEDLISYAKQHVFPGQRNITDRQALEWLEQHIDDIAAELDFRQAIADVAEPKQIVTKPVLEFNDVHGGKIRLYVGDAKQPIHVVPHKSQWFGGDPTASLVYSVQDNFGLNSIEHNINDAGLWQWIQKWMVRGMAVNPECKIDTGKHPELKD